MNRRGKILRDTATGPGLLVVDGTQLPFTLEGTWKSDMPPASGMVVDVAVDRGAVVSVAAVPEGQLAREQAEVALAAARAKGSALAGAAVARFGVPALVAAGALVVGWWVLTAGSLATPMGRLDFTFWEVLGIVHGGGAEVMMRRLAGGAGGSTGLYGLVAVLAVAGPFVHAVWKDRRAHLAGLLPLLLLALVAWKVLHLGPSADAAEAARALGRDGADFVREMSERANDELRKSVSIGVGTWVSGAAALYLALAATRRYLAASRTAQ